MSQKEFYENHLIQKMTKLHERDFTLVEKLSKIFTNKKDFMLFKKSVSEMTTGIDLCTRKISEELIANERSQESDFILKMISSLKTVINTSLLNISLQKQFNDKNDETENFPINSMDGLNRKHHKTMSFLPNESQTKKKSSSRKKTQKIEELNNSLIKNYSFRSNSVKSTIQKKKSFAKMTKLEESECKCECHDKINDLIKQITRYPIVYNDFVPSQIVMTKKANTTIFIKKDLPEKDIEIAANKLFKDFEDGLQCNLEKIKNPLVCIAFGNKINEALIKDYAKVDKNISEFLANLKEKSDNDNKESQIRQKLSEILSNNYSTLKANIETNVKINPEIIDDFDIHVFDFMMREKILKNCHLLFKIIQTNFINRKKSSGIHIGTNTLVFSDEISSGSEKNKKKIEDLEIYVFEMEKIIQDLQIRLIAFNNEKEKRLETSNLEIVDIKTGYFSNNNKKKNSINKNFDQETDINLSNDIIFQIKSELLHLSQNVIKNHHDLSTMTLSIDQILHSLKNNQNCHVLKELFTKILSIVSISYNSTLFLNNTLKIVDFENVDNVKKNILNLDEWINKKISTNFENKTKFTKSSYMNLSTITGQQKHSQFEKQESGIFQVNLESKRNFEDNNIFLQTNMDLKKDLVLEKFSFGSKILQNEESSKQENVEKVKKLTKHFSQIVNERKDEHSHVSLFKSKSDLNEHFDVKENNSQDIYYSNDQKNEKKEKKSVNIENRQNLVEKSVKNKKNGDFIKNKSNALKNEKKINIEVDHQNQKVSLNKSIDNSFENVNNQDFIKIIVESSDKILIKDELKSQIQNEIDKKSESFINDMNQKSSIQNTNIIKDEIKSQEIKIEKKSTSMFKIENSTNQKNVGSIIKNDKKEKSVIQKSVLKTNKIQNFDENVKKATAKVKKNINYEIGCNLIYSFIKSNSYINNQFQDKSRQNLHQIREYPQNLTSNSIDSKNNNKLEKKVIKNDIVETKSLSEKKISHEINDENQNQIQNQSKKDKIDQFVEDFKNLEIEEKRKILKFLNNHVEKNFNSSFFQKSRSFVINDVKIINEKTFLKNKQTQISSSSNIYLKKQIEIQKNIKNNEKLKNPQIPVSFIKINFSQLSSKKNINEDNFERENSINFSPTKIENTKTCKISQKLKKMSVPKHIKENFILDHSKINECIKNVQLIKDNSDQNDDNLNENMNSCSSNKINSLLKEKPKTLKMGFNHGDITSSRTFGFNEKLQILYNTLEKSSNFLNVKKISLSNLTKNENNRKVSKQKLSPLKQNLISRDKECVFSNNNSKNYEESKFMQSLFVNEHDKKQSEVEESGKIQMSAKRKRMSLGKINHKFQFTSNKNQ